MAAAVAQPVNGISDDHVMDTRTPSTSSPVQRSADESGDAQNNISADDAYQPDLSKEVSLLSTKLINAINYQTNLDDSLQASRHELEQANQELKRIKAEKQSLDDAVAQGVLVKRSEVEKTMAKLRAELVLEKEKRESAEKARRQTDGELENLTSSLFEEANKMVAEARKDTDTVEKRNSQLRSQLGDTEVLLASQQEQLQDLKMTMENLERTQTSARDSSIPSTPIISNTATFDTLQHEPSHDVPDVPPNHPLHFSQILLPVLRTDVSAYTDFAELLYNARKTATHSRNASGNMASASQTNLTTLSTTNAASSSPNLPGAFSFASSSASSSPSASTFSNTVNPPLKESKFYKRTVIEDLEPTLRLDLAPGLSFLSRRTVQSALLNGSLVVEPFAPSSNWKFYSPVFACALCGESRKDEPYTRKHRFRTSGSDDAQRYPLCDYCLGRIRAAGDFVGFLRMLRDGHWRCGNEEEEKAAWEEAVRLRERMFWARLGGGVVPAAFQRAQNLGPGTPSTTAAVRSARVSLESIPEQRSRRSTAASKPDAEVSLDRERQVSEGEVFHSPVDERPDALAESYPRDSSQEENSAEVEKSGEDFTRELRRRTMLRAGEEVPGLQEKLSEIAQMENSSQEAQDEASEQLKQEADAAQMAQVESSNLPNTNLDRFSTPQEEVKGDTENPDSAQMGPPPAPATEEPTQPVPSQSRSRDPSPSKARPSSSASASSQRDLAPPTAPEMERRPSSVLARVRAMEAAGGKK